MTGRRVCFITPEASVWRTRLETHASADPLASEFVTALEDGNLERTWLVQTWAQLRARGHDVALLDAFPDDRQAVCIHLSPLASRWGLDTLGGALRAWKEATARSVADSGRGCFRVSLGLDRPTPHSAHVVLFQNPVAARAHASPFVPHWPQPSLVPRDPARGDRLENVVFVGNADNLDPAFREASFLSALDALGMQLDVRHVSRWTDLREADVLLAIRGATAPPCMLARKPATKLVNAWQAGIPAILGPEPAYLSLRRSDLDYAEAQTPDAVLSILRTWKQRPDIVHAMAENGRRRFPEFDASRVAVHWIRLLEGPVEDAYRQWARRSPETPVAYRARLAKELAGAVRFWRRYDRERTKTPGR